MTARVCWNSTFIHFYFGFYLRN